MCCYPDALYGGIYLPVGRQRQTKNARSAGAFVFGCGGLLDFALNLPGLELFALGQGEGEHAVLDLSDGGLGVHAGGQPHRAAIGSIAALAQEIVLLALLSVFGLKGQHVVFDADVDVLALCE